MANQPTNRLDSLWPKPSADGSHAALVGAKHMADKLESTMQNLGAAIGRYPRASLTAAATLGAFFGWIIKRK